MHRSLLALVAVLCCFSSNAQVDTAKIREDLNEILADIAQQYVYRTDKGIDLNCLRSYYSSQIPNIKTEEQTVLFFEYLLDEFYDSHLILNANRRSSFRLYAPVYVKQQGSSWAIVNVWQTQFRGLQEDIAGAEWLSINGRPVDSAIAAFPTHCSDKRQPAVREWIANKLLAGRYNEPRRLALRLRSGRTTTLDLDSLSPVKNEGLLSTEKRNGIAIIRIHNSLGNNDLVTAFDRALDSLVDTKGLILDLRNTVDGGNTYVARGIMSRFITHPGPYQRHEAVEAYGNNPPVVRSWVEYVRPRGKTYSSPVLVLVGRWTGSMGEGLAIGFEGLGRGKVVGSEMERLAGEMEGFSFRHQRFGYRLSTARLFHINGTPRESYVPTIYVRQKTTAKDETLERALQLLGKTKRH